MRKTTLKIMIAVGAAAVLMTGCFGSKQAPAAPAEATTAAAAESAAESAAADSAGEEKKDGAGTEKKESGAAEAKESAAEETKEGTAAEETKEGTAAEESNVADESAAAGETSGGTQEGTSALLRSAASALQKQAGEAWGAYGSSNVHVNEARKLLIVSLNRAGLTDEAVRSMSQEDWAELTGKAQQLAAQCKSAMDKMGLKDYHVGVELVDSVGGKDYLKIVDGVVDYDVWGQIAGERAAAAAKAAAEALTQEETAAAPVVSTGFGPGAGLTPADGKPSERVTAAGAEAPAQQ